MTDSSNTVRGGATSATPEPVEISLYADRQKIYPRSVQGVFTNWRWATVWLTQIVFYGLPWLEWNDRQAVLFDLGERRFYLFNLILYPHDLIYLTGLLVISALALFLFTAVAGRLWCGFACPQTVYTEIYLWIEKLVEGDRSARMRLDKSGHTLEKYGKKTLKQVLWIAFGLWTGFTFVGYFTPIHELWAAVWAAQLGPWQSFWILFYGFATYGNAGYMREQVCKYMCPYARFQSAMFDRDTLIVTYDEQRGEPRGRRSRQADLAQLKLGACVDCSLCVQVCPTGIDIRKGLQYECIGCGSCADVCDQVMDKVGYERGLVRFTTLNGVQNQLTRAQMWRRVLRPRVLVYSGILFALTLALFVGLAARPPVKLDVIRDSSLLARQVGHGFIENVYTLRLLNTTETEQRFYVHVHGIADIRLTQNPVVVLPAVESHVQALTLRIPPGAAAPGVHTVYFELRTQPDAAPLATQRSTFIVPR